MRKRFGAPAILGAAAFAAVTLHSTGHPADDLAATAPGAGTTGDSDAASSGFGAADASSGTIGVSSGTSGIVSGTADVSSGADVNPTAAEIPGSVASAAAASHFDIRSAEYDIPAPAVRQVGDFGSWPAVERAAEPAGGSCAVIPFATLPPSPGIAAINGSGAVECTPSGIDTLRYSIPGPIRGADPGPPIQI
ncbi:hypothetical protein [Nocardia sp. CC227C]|uniref:hypothetical protein n=1 Tax=Nocardia sp. CC227C TaxID=3044562 RepID=UPI00278BCC7D|nr:hypothetical protein [Nocardia sp. CC227C]